MLVLACCGIEILIWSFEKKAEKKNSKFMQNSIFTLFVGVSMATVNMQTDICI